MVGCPGDLADRVTTQLFPAYEQMVKSLILLGLGELLIILWLLIKAQPSIPRTPDAERRQPRVGNGGPQSGSAVRYDPIGLTISNINMNLYDERYVLYR